MGNHRASGAAHKQLQRDAAHQLVCSGCGQRLGKHKYGTDQCPNTGWKPGNGQSQWLTTSFREHAWPTT